MKKEIEIENLGYIHTSGNGHVYTDWFHIFSKNALFNYDTAKAMNENFSKNIDFEYIAKADNWVGADWVDCNWKRAESVNFKNHEIASEPYDIDTRGPVINIIKLRIPNFAAGIACPYSMIFSAGDDGMSIDDWFTSSTLNNFIDFKPREETNALGAKSESTIEIKDNMICFAFFDPMISDNDLCSGIGLGFWELKDFFKIKNDENIKKFNIFISEKYRNLEPKKDGTGRVAIRRFCYKVPNGKFKIYDMWTNKSFLNSKMYNLLSDDLKNWCTIKKYGERISLGAFIRLK